MALQKPTQYTPVNSSVKLFLLSIYDLYMQGLNLIYSRFQCKLIRSSICRLRSDEIYHDLKGRVQCIGYAFKMAQPTEGNKKT